MPLGLAEADRVTETAGETGRVETLEVIVGSIEEVTEEVWEGVELLVDVCEAVGDTDRVGVWVTVVEGLGVGV